MGNACNVSDHEWPESPEPDEKPGYLGSTAPHKLRRNRSSGAFSFKAAQSTVTPLIPNCCNFRNFTIFLVFRARH